MECIIVRVGWKSDTKERSFSIIWFGKPTDFGQLEGCWFFFLVRGYERDHGKRTAVWKLQRLKSGQVSMAEGQNNIFSTLRGFCRLRRSGNFQWKRWYVYLWRVMATVRELCRATLNGLKILTPTQSRGTRLVAQRLILSGIISSPS